MLGNAIELAAIAEAAEANLAAAVGPFYAADAVSAAQQLARTTSWPLDGAAGIVLREFHASGEIIGTQGELAKRYRQRCDAQALRDAQAAR